MKDSNVIDLLTVLDSWIADAEHTWEYAVKQHNYDLARLYDGKLQAYRELKEFIRSLP